MQYYISGNHPTFRWFALAGMYGVALWAGAAARRLDRHRGARAAGAGERNVAADVMTGGG
jgi:hypothetical protein